MLLKDTETGWFEKVLPAFLVEVGVRDGAGCDPSFFSKEEQEGKIVADQFRGECATCFHVKDRGLVVIGSCSHSGLINAIRQAQAVSGVEKVHAVMGGFHLAPAPEPSSPRPSRPSRRSTPTT